MFDFLKRSKKAIPARAPNPLSISSPLKQSLRSLEPRLMFDAAAAATAAEVKSEQVAQDQAEAAVSTEASHEATSTEMGESQDVLKALATFMPAEERTEVVFVDPTVPNYQELLTGMDPNIEVIMLDAGKDGVQQIADNLAGRTGVDAIHIISHGSAGELQLGTGTLNTETMSGQYAEDLATIQQGLSEKADVLVYGCDFAKGDAGHSAVEMLAQLTGADVEASTDLTGSISLGGDWDFEVKTGTIETSVAVDCDAQMNWAGVLGTKTVADTFSAKSFGNNDGTHSWSTRWSEVDVGSSEANGGHIKVNSGQLRIDTQVVGNSVSRGVDLGGASRATLSFDYDNGMSKGGSVEVRLSTDGGANYRTLSDGTFSKAGRTGQGTASFDLSGPLSANTKIQFLVTGGSGGDRLTIDNVQVDYSVADVNHTPTDITPTGGGAVENASTGTVVGTVAEVDADAGGRSAINANTGVLTVAAGSLLNCEANASHSTTVRVTDSGGQSYDKPFTIGVTEAADASPRQSLPGALAPISPTSGPENSGPLVPSTGVSGEITGDGIRPQSDLQRSLGIGTKAALSVESLSPERAPTQSGPIESLNVLHEHVTAAEFQNRSSSWSGDSGDTQGQEGPISVRSGDGKQADEKESDQPVGPVDAAATTDVGLAVGLAGVVFQGGLLPRKKKETLKSLFHGNELPSPAGQDGRPHGHDLDGQESPSSHDSEPDERRSS